MELNRARIAGDMRMQGPSHRVAHHAAGGVEIDVFKDVRAVALPSS
jgi:hypothetical protein